MEHQIAIFDAKRMAEVRHRRNSGLTEPVRVEFEPVPDLTDENEEALFAATWEEVQLADCGFTAEALEEIRASLVHNGWASANRSIFLSYANRKEPLGVMSMADLMAFAKASKMLDKRLTTTQVRTSPCRLQRGCSGAAHLCSPLPNPAVEPHLPARQHRGGVRREWEHVHPGRCDRQSGQRLDTIRIPRDHDPLRAAQVPQGQDDDNRGSS